MIANQIAPLYPETNAIVSFKPFSIEICFTKSKIETEIVIPKSMPTFRNIAKIPEAIPIFPGGATDTIKAFTEG